MAYKHHSLGHVPAGEDEARAKFAYFREAEAGINGGPASAETPAPEPLPVPKKLKLKRPAPPPRNIPKCGEYSGWSRHNREGTDPCRACMDAQAAYQRDYRATLRQMKVAA